MKPFDNISQRNNRRSVISLRKISSVTPDPVLWYFRIRYIVHVFIKSPPIKPIYWNPCASFHMIAFQGQLIIVYKAITSNDQFEQKACDNNRHNHTS